MKLLDKEVLTIKGLQQSNTKYIENLKIKYNDLILSNRLVFDFQYIEQESIEVYLNEFSIGFCFYNLEFLTQNDFNYISSPSGKMFNYFNSRVPTIGINFVGLYPIEQYEAGILIDSYTPDEIFKSIIQIKEKYNYYVLNTEIVSNLYDYRQMFLNAKNKIYDQ